MTRIYHTWDKWECYPAGFYEEKPVGDNFPDWTKDELEKAYAAFLGDDERFKSAALRVVKEWPKSSEHYLTNENMNRIAWIGQASACLALGIPSAYRGGFHLLDPEGQKRADLIALTALNEWLKSRGEPEITYEQAQSKTEANLY